MAKDSGFNLVEMLNRRSKEQLKGEGAEEEGGEEVMVRGKGVVAAFDSWEAFLGALDMSRASYVGEV